MMEYFVLQWKMTCRKVADLGLHPIIGFCLLGILFWGATLYLFARTEFAEYILVLVALSCLTKLSERSRNDFLKSTFSRATYRCLRVLENVLIALPFMLCLACKQLYFSLWILVSLALVMALIHYKTTLTWTLPTPFFRKPFEFTVGFRSAFFFVIFTYFLTFQAVLVGNFNLGVFSLLLIFGISFSFFLKPEPELYVWIFAKTPREFLAEKIKTALWYSTLLGLPIGVVLGIFFRTQWGALLLVFGLGYLYVIMVIMAKYSAYPYEINLPQATLIGFSLLFPPMLLGTIPFFYWKSIKQLQGILE